MNKAAALTLRQGFRSVLPVRAYVRQALNANVYLDATAVRRKPWVGEQELPKLFEAQQA